MNKIKLTAVMMLIASAAIAQPNSGAPIVEFHNLLMMMLGVLLVVLLLLVFTLQKVVYMLKIESSGGKYPVTDEQPFLEKILSLKPLSAEKDIELDHDFDGIKELNNPIPVWFNFLFYGTIVIGIIYFLTYHVFEAAPLQTKEYETELLDAEVAKQDYIKKAGNLIDENSVTMLTDKAKIAEGAKVYAAKCVVCHGEKGEGKVGPNLTDDYWIYGGDVHSIFKTIKYGVPSKGMVAWQNSMNGAQMQELASYVLTLQGTNPAGAKEPQGDKVADASSALAKDSISSK